MTANNTFPVYRRLFFTDQDSIIKFLIDTEADLCVYPRMLTRGRHSERTTYELYVANNSVIATYGFITLTLDLGLRRDFTWRFVVADIS